MRIKVWGKHNIDELKIDNKWESKSADKYIAFTL